MNARPSRLFHYQPYQKAHLTALLEQGTIKMASPASFNDPWDCRVNYRAPRSDPEMQLSKAWLLEMHRRRVPEYPEEQRPALVESFLSDPAKISNFFPKMNAQMYDAISRQYRVYCLCEEENVSLLWSHYSRSHSGICIGFDTSISPFDTTLRINYVTEFPSIPIYDTADHLFLTYKSNDWAYENEWRLIAEEETHAQSSDTIHTKDGLFKLLPACVRSVTIGCLASENDRAEIYDLVKSLLPDVEVRQAQVIPDRYALKIEAAAPSPNDEESTVER